MSVLYVTIYLLLDILVFAEKCYQMSFYFTLIRLFKEIELIENISIYLLTNI